MSARRQFEMMKCQSAERNYRKDCGDDRSRKNENTPRNRHNAIALTIRNFFQENRAQRCKNVTEVFEMMVSAAGLEQGKSTLCDGGAIILFSG